MRYKVILIGLFISLVLVNIACGSNSVSANPEDALISVQKFLGKSDLNPISFRTDQGEDDEYFVILTKDGEFYVSVSNLDVERAYFIQNFQNNKNIYLSQSNAFDNAKIFVVDHYPSFLGKKMVLTDAFLQNHGDAGSEYMFIWREIIDGIITPNFAFVSVNPETGQIMGYIGKDQEIKQPILNNSIISEKEAINIAKEQVNNVKIDSIHSQIRLIFDKTNSQKLIWEIIVEATSNMPSRTYFNSETKE